MVKARLILITGVLSYAIAHESLAQNVGINTTGVAANASSILDLSSTSSGFLVPRMTLAQRNAIASPATGLLIYQTDGVPGFYYFDGTIWVALASNSFYQNTFFDQGTGSASVTTTTWVGLPGLSRTITLTAPAKVVVYSDGGLQNTSGVTSGSSATAIIDVALFVNGGLAISTYGGGFKRLCAANNASWTGLFEYWSLQTVMTLAPGTYTIAVQSRKGAGTGGNASVSGNNTVVMQGIMKIQIIYQ
jgi:hypothetical protein